MLNLSRSVWVNKISRIPGILLPVFAALVLAMTTGCPFLFMNRQRYEAEAEALFQTAQGFYERGDYDMAIATFTNLIKDYSRSELVDDSYYLAALSFARKKDWEHAVGAAQAIIKDFPRSPLAAKVRIVLAEGYENMGYYSQALAAYLETVIVADDLRDRARAESQAKNLLGRENDYAFLSELYQRYRDTTVAEWLLYRLGTLAYEQKDYQVSEAYFAELRERFPASPYIAQIEGKDISASVLKEGLIVGVLLPLSGSLSSYGLEVKNGLELAQSLNPNSKIHLEYYDTGTDPGEAARGAEVLIRKGASILIGPLTSAGVGAAAKAAKDAGVVMISPTSTDPGLLNIYHCLYQLNSYPELETKEIARYALSQGIKNFGILYPANDQGKQLADVFAKTVQSAGGTVVYSKILSDTVVEMKSTLVSVRHTNAQAVFLPFDRQQLLSLVPQIAYYKVRVRMLGVDDFTDEEILRRGGIPFEGVWFASPPSRLVNPMQFESFFNHFKNTYSRDPDWAAALGYDSYNFIYRALEEGKSKSLCEALRMLDDRRGIMGRLVFSDDGTWSAVRIYTIKDEEIKEIK